MAISLNSKGKNKASSLISAGNIDKESSWSFTADDGNQILGDPPDWGKYSQWFLGVDGEAEEETKEAWHYPFGKDGKVYRSALIAIRQRASQQGATDIFDAAGALIEKIDGPKEDNMKKRCMNKSPFKKGVKGEYRIENSAEESIVYLYDEVSWWGVSADQFVKDLNDIQSPMIHLHINSPGGDVFDGTAIYNALKQHSAKVVAHIDGIAASISSVIAMGADEIHMGDGAYLMIHEPWTFMAGNADDLRKEADLLDKVGGTIANIYSERSGKNIDEIKQLMKDESWLTAEEAVELGLADKIDKGKQSAKAQVKNLFDLSIFNNVPSALKDQPTPRDLEHALKSAGCSANVAKTILSKGMPGYQREVGDPVPSEPQREVDVPVKDRTNDLLIQGEILAPKQKVE